MATGRLWRPVSTLLARIGGLRFGVAGSPWPRFMPVLHPSASHNPVLADAHASPHPPPPPKTLKAQVCSPSPGVTSVLATSLCTLAAWEDIHTHDSRSLRASRPSACRLCEPRLESAQRVIYTYLYIYIYIHFLCSLSLSPSIYIYIYYVVVYSVSCVL